jgi:hypothetical protein
VTVLIILDEAFVAKVVPCVPIVVTAGAQAESNTLEAAASAKSFTVLLFIKKFLRNFHTISKHILSFCKKKTSAA